ncbi:MAG: hypothetical protein ACFFKA_00160 [Candidatus Thorarchaeota archaeon]
MGYVKVDSEELMEELSEIVNELKHEHKLVIEEEEADFLIIDNIEFDALDKIHNAGFFNDSEFLEASTVDQLKFYVD